MIKKQICCEFGESTPLFLFLRIDQINKHCFLLILDYVFSGITLLISICGREKPTAMGWLSLILWEHTLFYVCCFRMNSTRCTSTAALISIIEDWGLPILFVEYCGSLVLTVESSFSKVCSKTLRFFWGVCPSLNSDKTVNGA